LPRAPVAAAIAGRGFSRRRSRRINLTPAAMRGQPFNHAHLQGVVAGDARLLAMM
jgi:hypothetical protein